MRFSSARASLWLAVFVVVVMVLPALSLTVGAAYTYQTNLGKIDPAVFAPPSSSGPSTTSSPTGATASVSQNSPNGAGFSVAMVKLKDLASASWGPRGHDFVVQSLQDVSARAQAPIVQLVNERGGTVLHRFWLMNALLVAADAVTLRDIAQNPLVEKVYPNFAVNLPPEQVGRAEPAQGPYEWNIEKVNAPGAWALGITGSGVRDCVTDTGVDISHPDLQGRMFTTDPSDPYYPGGWMEFDGNGNPVSSTPHDSWIHGTHVSGTIAGDSAGGTAIGVAPGVWLMHGLVLPGGGGTFAEVIAGMEWCVNPFDLSGNPTGYPAHVQSMSWGDTGGGLQDQLLDPIKNSLLANVIPVAAIGNEGPGSARSPGDIWGTFGAGATDINDNVADFSSGKMINWPNPPSDWPFFGGWPSSPYVKPDFSAPGVNVKSTVPGGGYEYLSGTSMATPHLSATVSLMVQASAFSLTPEQAYINLENSVLDLGDPGQDTRYGWGRIDTYKAVLLSLVANTGVKGTVYDSVSGGPLEGVRVTAKELGAYTTTNVTGTFKMGLPEGSYNISFDKFGYFSQVVPVEVKLYNGTVNGLVTDTASSPISGAAVTFVQANLTVYTDASGYYTASVKNGTYNVQADAAGYVPTTQSVSVPENGTTWANFTLFPNIPATLTGTVSDSVTLAPIAGALVWAEGPAKYQGLTNASGVYSIEISSVDAGTYHVGAFAGGYWPQNYDVTVVPGSTTVADFADAASDPGNVAIYEDFQGQLSGLLSSVGYTPWAYQIPNAIDLKWSVSAFPAIYWSGFSTLNDSTNPAPGTFLDVLAIAGSVGTSIVFADSYNGWPYGIQLLSTNTGDPVDRTFTFNEGNVYFHIVADHPIFYGVGSVNDTVYVINQSSTDDGDHTWFSGYTGDLLAHVGTDNLGLQGDGVAVRAIPGGTQWVLLGSLAPQYWTNLVTDWTPNAMKVATNSVDFARNNSWVAGAGTHSLAVRPSDAGQSSPPKASGRSIAPVAYVELTIYLVQMPSGFVEGTVTDTNGLAVPDVQIRATGTPAQTLTDANGFYSIELPVGTWTITAKKFGYQSVSGMATVTDGGTTTLDFILVPQRRIAIMYDDQGNPLQMALEATDKFAIQQFAGNWDELTAQVSNFDAVILNALPFQSIEPSQAQFMALLDAADASGTGIVFLDGPYGWNSPFVYAAPYGISLLVKYVGDPSTRSEAGFCFGALYQEITAKHGMTRGYNAGDNIQVNSNTCAPVSTFSGFSGTTVGRLWTGYSQPQNMWGDNLAYKITAAGNRWALLSAYAPVFGYYGNFWTNDGKNIIVNSVFWASTQPLQLSINPQSGRVGTSVAFTGSGAPASVALNVNFDEATVGNVQADASGGFSGSLVVPEAVFGDHSVVVMTPDESFAGEQAFGVVASLVLTPTSGPPSSGIGVAGHGYPAGVFVDLSFGSMSSGRALTGADGSFGTTVIVPSVTGGDYSISGLNLDSGASASAAFRVIEQVALDVQVSVGTLHFRGEVAEFYVLVTGQGTMRAAAIEADLWSPSGTSQSLIATEVAVGLYKATYTLPGNAPTGTYALVAQASVSETYLTGSGSGLATFLVSPTLTSQNNALLSIQGDIAQVRTDTGTIFVDLNAVSASLTSIQGDTATISTSIGTLTANLAALDAKITSIDGGVATVQTTLGTVRVRLDALDAKITTIQGDVATIKTNAGTANQQLTSLQSSGGLVAMSSASVAAILSAVAAVFALAAWRAARRPKP